jgi:hypothetical protein
MPKDGILYNHGVWWRGAALDLARERSTTRLEFPAWRQASKRPVE